MSSISEIYWVIMLVVAGLLCGIEILGHLLVWKFSGRSPFARFVRLSIRLTTRANEKPVLRSITDVERLSGGAINADVLGRHWDEFLRYREEGWYLRDNSGRIIAHRDWTSATLNVHGGERRTIPDHTHSNVQNIWLLGASAVFSAENPDDATIASHLSALLGDAGRPHRVRNTGICGVTLDSGQQGADSAIESVLERLALNKGDRIILYVGANEIGRAAVSRLARSQLMRWAIELLRRLTPLSVLADFAYCWIFAVQQSRTIIDDQAIHRVRASISRLNATAVRADADLIVALQPNLCTKRMRQPEEDRLLSIYDPAWTAYIRRSTTKLYRQLSMSFSVVDLRSALDGVSALIYLDWVHLNSIGNRMIAHHLLSRLFVPMQVESVTTPVPSLQDPIADDEGVGESTWSAWSAMVRGCEPRLRFDVMESPYTYPLF